MATTDPHPALAAARSRPPSPPPTPLSLEEVRAIALAAGADDAGWVSLDHPELAEEKPHVLAAMPGARSLVAIVLRMHPENVRSPRRNVANLEFHRTGHEVDEVAARIARALSERGHRAMNPPMAFPMDMSSFPGRSWIVSHKRVAEAAQLGKMGLHRNLIHPRFGSFVLLGTVRIDDGELEVQPGVLAGSPDLLVRADGQLWLDIVSGRCNPVWAVLRRRLRITGDRRLLDRFAACFPR